MQLHAIRSSIEAMAQEYASTGQGLCLELPVKQVSHVTPDVGLAHLGRK